MYFAKNMRYLRKKKGKTLEDVAKIFDYKSYTTIQKWELGISEPSLGTAYEICNYFEVSLNDMVYKDLEHEELKELSDDSDKIVEPFNKLDDHGKEKLLDRANELINLGYTHDK